MTIDMEKYAQIRRLYEDGHSQREISRQVKNARKTVKRYCEGGAIPGKSKPREREATVLTPEMVEFIEECLNEDEREGLKKQKHTAKRIYDRLVAEKGFKGGESTVRRKVRELRGGRQKVFIPLSFEPGEAMQVDWGEAVVYLRGERQKINLFCSRLCYSCRPVVLAYTHQNEESFLDAFVRVFGILGGAPRRVVFDNARVAVKEGFGIHAKKQDGYTALSAHYAFSAEFCNIASGNEKGLVENLVAWSRNNILVPVPRVESLSELNDLLVSNCTAYEGHEIAGRGRVGELFQSEQGQLRGLPLYPFETARCQNARVSAFSTVRFLTNDYSVPIQYVGQQVGVKGYPETVQIYKGGSLIAEHKRLFGKHEKSCRLEDYLPLLEERSRAIFNAVPVKQHLTSDQLEELRANMSNREKVLEILRRAAKLPQGSKEPGSEARTEEVRIEDPLKIREVDLQEYDSLVALAQEQ